MTSAFQKTSPRMSPSRLLPVYCPLWEAWSHPRNWNLVTQHRMSMSPFITQVHLKFGKIGPLICKIDFKSLWWPLCWCQAKTGTSVRHTTGSKKRKRRADKINGQKNNVTQSVLKSTESLLLTCTYRVILCCQVHRGKCHITTTSETQQSTKYIHTVSFQMKCSGVQNDLLFSLYNLTQIL